MDHIDTVSVPVSNVNWPQSHEKEELYTRTGVLVIYEKRSGYGETVWPNYNTTGMVTELSKVQ